MWPQFSFKEGWQGGSFELLGSFLFCFGGFCEACVKDCPPPALCEILMSWAGLGGRRGTENMIEQENKFSNRRNIKQKTLKCFKEFSTFPTKMAFMFRMLPKGITEVMVSWLASGDWILKTPGQLSAPRGTEDGSPGSEVPAGNMPCTPTMKWEKKSS